MVDISIIIPVYKAEPYLRRCLDSILHQTFRNYEVILVDDGSPDKSGEICDEYVQKDRRFRVIHKENGGVSSARAAGVQSAQGIYSIQIDPDDWIEDSMLQLMYDKSLEDSADIVVCEMVIDRISSSFVVSNSKRPSTFDELFDMFLTGRFPASLGNKLIRHSLYNKANFVFNTKITRWEDTHAVCSLMYETSKISFVDVPLYHYDFHSNSNSLTRKVTMDGLKSQMMVCDYFMGKFKGTVHEPAVHLMRKSTKSLGYNVLKAQDYIRLYEEYNRDVALSGLRGKAGISGVFMALTIMTRTQLPQYIYNKLKKLS